jgi:hypothetical protein
LKSKDITKYLFILTLSKYYAIIILSKYDREVAYEHFSYYTERYYI